VGQSAKVFSIKSVFIDNEMQGSIQ